MHTNTLLTALLICTLPACAQPTATTPTDAKIEWRLVWSDEFNDSKLDESKWRAEEAALVKNNERQYYAADHVVFRDGKAVIRSTDEARGGRPYTSGLIESRGRFAQAFGRFEARMKLPRTQGIWPAFWMLPEDGRWPPEIDIMEVLGHQPTKTYMSNHWGKWPNNKHETSSFEGPDFSAGFHTYACEWFPDRIDFYVDGVKHATHKDGVPQDPFYIIFNTAVGGDWPGFPDDTTVFPQAFEIDWVRVYEPIEAGRTYLHIESDGGQIDQSESKWAFAPAESITLEATPHMGRRFVKWEGVPVDQSTQNPITLTMSENRRVRAVYETDPTPLQPISRGAKVSATSTERSDLRPEFAVDGDTGTRWASEFSDPQSITLDLGSVQPVRGVRLLWEGAYARRYAIEASKDGETWETIAAIRSGRGGEEVHRANLDARYIRMSGERRGTNYGYSLWEFEVYGPK